MKTRLLAAVLWLTAIIPGFSSVVVCAYYILIDWASLRHWYAQWEKLAASGTSISALAISESHQNVFRTNVFAEGVWLLQGAALCALGLIGLCILKRD